MVFCIEFLQLFSPVQKNVFIIYTSSCATWSNRLAACGSFTTVLDIHSAYISVYVTCCCLWSMPYTPHMPPSHIKRDGVPGWQDKQTNRQTVFKLYLDGHCIVFKYCNNGVHSHKTKHTFTGLIRNN